LVKYGAESPYSCLWIQVDKDVITAACLQYHTALHLFSKEKNIALDELINHIKTIAPSIICASSDFIRLLEPKLKIDGYIPEYGHVGKYVKTQIVSSNYTVMRATDDDVEAIANMLYEDDDIGASYTMVDLVKQIKERIQQGFVRSYIIKCGDEVVAHLGTGAELSNVCTISYVITSPKHRGKGLSTCLFQYACNELVKEGKDIFSVYYPENSRRLHHKMGFVDSCECGKLFLNKK
jgi:hypothetical protein